MKHRSITRLLLTLAAVLSFTALSDVFRAFGVAAPVPLPAEELAELEKVFSHADEYSARRATELKLMRDSLLKPLDLRQRWGVAFRLGEKWLTFNADSALHYSRTALDIATRTGDEELMMLSRMQEIRCLSSVGMLMWAQPKLIDMDTVGFSRRLMTDYWRTSRHFAYAAYSYAANHEPYRKDAAEWYARCNDRLIEALPPERPYTVFLISERLFDDGHYAEARTRLETLLKTLDPTDNLYGMAAYRLAEVYRLQGDGANYARYMTLAAISDIKGAVREGWALPALATFLYEQGELNDAYRYMNFAFREATQSSSRMRTLDMAYAVPMIDEAYRYESTTSHDRLVVYFILTALLLLLSVGLSLGLWRQIKRGRNNAQRLARLSKLQESYIGNFVDLCASYSSRCDSMSKLVMRKLSSGQADELLKMINSGKFGTGDQDEDFYKVIDSAFLDLYPTFVEDVNALLKPECQLALKTPGVLTPELRICAMIRLGVDSGARMAKILGYSVNTVYAYRNRMKQRAIDPDRFTEDIMQIGRSSKDF